MSNLHLVLVPVSCPSYPELGHDARSKSMHQEHVPDEVVETRLAGPT
jgi:hypothetical protein